VYLIFFAFIAEIFSFSIPGLMLVVVFLPRAIFRVLGKLQADLSFKFGIVVTLTALMQVVVLYLPDIYVAKDLLVVPWLRIASVVLFTSVAALLTSVAIFFNWSE
jgi:hypothetical protein